MNRGRKWIIAAAVLLVLGLLLCGVSYRLIGFDFGKLSTVRYTVKTYEVAETFRNIRIDADTGKIALVPSRDGTCSVVCHEEENAPHRVEVQGDTLTIERKDQHTWKFMNIGLITESPEITVYLSDNEYKALAIEAGTGDVNIPGAFRFGRISVTLDTGDAHCLASAEGDISIQTDTGEITVSDLSAAGMWLASDTGRIDVSNVSVKGDIELKENTGKVTMENVTCRNLSSNGDTGRLVMTNTVASGVFNLERSTGDIKLNGCDAETICIKTDTGDVSGRLLSDKVFLTETDTGKVDVPKSITGGRCEITTDSGDITVEVSNQVLP